MTNSTSTLRIEHLARVEGHGGITITMKGDQVLHVWLDIFEGSRLFETLVRGRRFDEASQIVSRICSICSTSHALAAILAIERAMHVEVSALTNALRELMHLGENIESHALHLFLLAAPDYLDYPSAIALAADKPSLVKLGLRLKNLGNVLQEVIGGRAIHPVNAIPGGFARLPTIQQMLDLRQRLEQGREDCQAAVALLSSLPPADFCHASTVFAALRDSSIVVKEGAVEEQLEPGCYRTLTNEEKGPFSNAKRSLYRDRPFMVGALARLNVNPGSLTPGAQAAVEQLGLSLASSNPMDNNKAQAVELVILIDRALSIVRELIEEGWQAQAPVVVRARPGNGVAVLEAPRGLLIHNYTFDQAGYITEADVVTPTAMNAASMEHHFRVAVERSDSKERAVLTRKVEMLARAYDPCLSCSVHLIQASERGRTG
jgi:sulfhydrogenase subunit alpha